MSASPAHLRKPPKGGVLLAEAPLWPIFPLLVLMEPQGLCFLFISFFLVFLLSHEYISFYFAGLVILSGDCF